MNCLKAVYCSIHRNRLWFQAYFSKMISLYYYYCAIDILISNYAAAMFQFSIQEEGNVECTVLPSEKKTLCVHYTAAIICHVKLKYSFPAEWCHVPQLCSVVIDAPVCRCRHPAPFIGPFSVRVEWCHMKWNDILINHMPRGDMIMSLSTTLLHQLSNSSKLHVFSVSLPQHTWFKCSASSAEAWYWPWSFESDALYQGVMESMQQSGPVSRYAQG